MPLFDENGAVILQRKKTTNNQSANGIVSNVSTLNTSTMNIPSTNVLTITSASPSIAPSTSSSTTITPTTISSTITTPLTDDSDPAENIISQSLRALSERKAAKFKIYQKSRTYHQQQIVQKKIEAIKLANSSPANTNTGSTGATPTVSPTTVITAAQPTLSKPSKKRHLSSDDDNESVDESDSDDDVKRKKQKLSTAVKKAHDKAEMDSQKVKAKTLAIKKLKEDREKQKKDLQQRKSNLATSSSSASTTVNTMQCSYCYTNISGSHLSFWICPQCKFTKYCMSCKNNIVSKAGSNIVMCHNCTSSSKSVSVPIVTYTPSTTVPIPTASPTYTPTTTASIPTTYTPTSSVSTPAITSSTMTSDGDYVTPAFFPRLIDMGINAATSIKRGLGIQLPTEHLLSEIKQFGIAAYDDPLLPWPSTWSTELQSLDSFRDRLMSTQKDESKIQLFVSLEDMIPYFEQIKAQHNKAYKPIVAISPGTQYKLRFFWWDDSYTRTILVPWDVPSTFTKVKDCKVMEPMVFLSDLLMPCIKYVLM